MSITYLMCSVRSRRYRYPKSPHYKFTPQVSDRRDAGAKTKTIPVNMVVFSGISRYPPKILVREDHYVLLLWASTETGILNMCRVGDFGCSSGRTTARSHSGAGAFESQASKMCPCAEFQTRLLTTIWEKKRLFVFSWKWEKFFF